VRPDPPAAERPDEDGPPNPAGPSNEAVPSAEDGPAGDGGTRPSRSEPGEVARHREKLEGTVSGKAARKLRARREGDRGIWFGLGMMGLVGWSVAVPTVVGIALGVWLDRRSADPGGVSWTLTGLVVGVAIGCVNAWVWIQRELHGRD
jgi:ATP synthase protein I